MQSEKIMSKTVAVLGASLALVFETAIFGEQPGIGYIVFWTFTLLATALILNSAERLQTRRLWMFLPSLLLSFAAFRYDAEVVRVFGTTLALFTLAWAVAWNLLSEWSENCLAYLLPSKSWNPLTVSSNARNGLKVEHRMESETVVQTLRGLVLSGCLLLVFGTLLCSADAVFSSKLSEIGRFFECLAPLTGLRWFLWTVLFVGLLRTWLVHQAPGQPRAATFFGSTELQIALGSLNLLLLSFLLVQARYLFGDSRLVESLGFSHAEYARRGFFELTVCIALILPLVLTSYRASEMHREPKLRFLGGGLIAGALGLAVSALKRMMLYISVYGLSVERFYAAAGIVVAMSVLGWAAYACWRPQTLGWLLARQKVTVILMLAALGLVNVDALVAQSHLNLVQHQVRDLDSYYLATLSSDALPVFEQYLPNLTEQDQKDLKQAALRILERTPKSGWEGFNVSRHQAAERARHWGYSGEQSAASKQAVAVPAPAPREGGF